MPMRHYRFPLILMLLIAVSGCSRSAYIKPAENVVAINQPGDTQLSCAELDNEISGLYRQAMEMAPEDFYEDNSNAGAMFIGSIAFTPAYLYMLQNEVVDKPKDRERIQAMVKRIEVLQRLKAQKHCFESP